MSIRPSASAANDRLFWLALLAGPLCWLLLWQLTPPLRFRPDWPLTSPLPLLMATLVYPPLEEIVFRGWLQGSLLQRPALVSRMYGISCANLLASLAFALLHLLNHSPFHAAGVFVPSLLFGLFYERHQRLSSPMLLHGWYNLGYVYLFGS